MELYNALIVPIALYGSKTWTLWKAEEKLLVFEMAALRKILGVHITYQNEKLKHQSSSQSDRHNYAKSA